MQPTTVPALRTVLRRCWCWHSAPTVRVAARPDHVTAVPLNMSMSYVWAHLAAAESVEEQRVPEPRPVKCLNDESKNHHFF